MTDNFTRQERASRKERVNWAYLPRPFPSQTSQNHLCTRGQLPSAPEVMYLIIFNKIHISPEMAYLMVQLKIK